MNRSFPRVLLGVSGSIAAYKAVEVLRLLQKSEIQVRVAMTKGATQFVTPLTFETLTGSPVFDDLWTRKQGRIEHVEQSHESELFLVAPASANLLAKIVNGLADDPVTTTALSTKAPIAVAPAMEDGMWYHPATQMNLETLRSRGVVVIEPTQGSLASGRQGHGRMEEPAIIVERVLSILNKDTRALAGESILITAGPTWESLDPVRILTNRSTGAMGLALADEATRRGAKVRLILGPTYLEPKSHPCLEVVRVETALEMLNAAQSELRLHSIVVGAAAVSDFRLAETKVSKWKRSEPGAEVLKLTENPDILKTISEELRRYRADALVVGFAAETENVEHWAKHKMQRKGCDIVVGNLVGTNKGFGSGNTEVMLVSQQFSTETLASATKPQVANFIWDKVEVLRSIQSGGQD